MFCEPNGAEPKPLAPVFDPNPDPFEGLVEVPNPTPFGAPKPEDGVEEAPAPNWNGAFDPLEEAGAALPDPKLKLKPLFVGAGD